MSVWHQVSEHQDGRYAQLKAIETNNRRHSRYIRPSYRLWDRLKDAFIGLKKAVCCVSIIVFDWALTQRISDYSFRESSNLFILWPLKSKYNKKPLFTSLFGVSVHVIQPEIIKSESKNLINVIVSRPSQINLRALPTGCKPLRLVSNQLSEH